MAVGVVSDSHSKGLRMLETLAGMEQPASLLKLAGAMHLSKASAYRLLRSLQREGFVDHVGRSGYRIGGRAIALASLMGPRSALLQRAQPVLARLSSVASETTSMHVRSGSHRVVVLAAEPLHVRERRRPRRGERAPLTSGCGGLAILAFLPPDQIASIIDPAQLPPTRRHSLSDELERIRETGYALSFSANHEGLHGVGAPLIDPEDGYALGSLVIAGVPSRLCEADLRSLSAPLRAACVELAPQVAAVLGPNSTVRYEAMDVTIQGLVGMDDTGGAEDQEVSPRATRFAPGT